MHSRYRLALLTLVFILLVTACTATPPRSPQPGPDWSRGQHLGFCSFNDQIALLPEADGRRVHLAWGQVGEGGEHIQYVQVGEQGQVLVQKALALEVQQPRQVRLLTNARGGLMVLYLSGRGTERRVFAAGLDEQGDVQGAAQAVSSAMAAADGYVAIPTAGNIEVFWSSSDGPAAGLYHVRLAADGHPQSARALLAAGGFAPDAQLDQEGRLHLVWVQEASAGDERICYALFAPEAGELVQPVEVASLARDARTVRYGPVLALSSTQVFILWSWERRTSGVTSASGTGECHYVAFPVSGAVARAAVHALALPGDTQPAYVPAKGDFAYSHLVPPAEESSPLVYMPCSAPGQRKEAAIAVAYETASRARSQVEVGVAYLADGVLEGYQIVGRSDGLAMRPVLRADAMGRLYLAWLEVAGVGRYRVYWASMNPATRAALGRLGLDDVGRVALDTVWALVQSFSLAPLGIVWLFVPFVFVIGYYLVKADGELYRRGPRMALAVAILLYVFCKFFVLPANFVGAAPWLEIMSPRLAGVYVFALPVAILSLALGAMAFYIRRRETPTLLVAYFVFGLTDCLVTFLVYARGIYG